MAFIYEKGSQRLLQHITGTNENEVIRQALVWSEKNSLSITTEALERLQGASEHERSTETELLQNSQNGSATDEIDSTLEKFYPARRSTRKTQSYRRDPPNAHLTTAIIGWMKPGICDFIGKRGIAKITTAAGRAARDFVSHPSVNRLINFPVLVFLSLFALMVLLNSSAILSRFLQPTLKSEKTTARAAAEKASLVRADVADPFLDPVQVKVQADHYFAESSIDVSAYKLMPKPDAAVIRREEHVHSPVSVKTVFRPRITTNLVTRIHSRSVAFYQLGLAHEIGAFAPYRQSIGGAGRFVHKDALATRTNGRSWKKIRSDSRKFERQLAFFFRSMWRRGRYALGL